MDLDFANALIGLFQSLLHPRRLQKNLQRRQSIPKKSYINGLKGKKSLKKMLEKFHVFETLNKTNSKTFLHSLVAFLKLTGHKGLILLFDELETVLAQGASIRNAAYENVRLADG